MNADRFNDAVKAHQEGRVEEALSIYSEVLASNPDHVPSLFNAGLIHRVQGAFEIALANWRRVAMLQPDHYAAHMAEGRLLNQLGSSDAASTAFQRALAARPGDIQAIICLGNAARRSGKLREALAFYDEALAIEPDNGPALASRGYLLGDMGAAELAIDSLRRAVLSDPSLVRAMGAKFGTQLRLCDWSEFESSRDAIRDAIRRGLPADLPWSFLIHTDDPVEQRQAAMLHARGIIPPIAAPLWAGERYGHDRIRVAYLSADFREHATSYLLAEALERHDRSRFEVSAYAIGPRVDDDARRRVAAAVEYFSDVSQMTDAEIANLIRAAEVDLLVDLNVYTTHSRPQIIAARCAPVQINYLGYPGTAGSRHYDYILADREVIPPGCDDYYSERIIRLPYSYQASPSMKTFRETDPLDRGAAGLPAAGFVFCCFNTALKLTPSVFATWMSLLHECSEAVLWLIDDGEIAKRNLRAEAERHGVDPDRLVFAPRLPREAHLARHRLADLFLDTWPCNAHTTANDALLMGLPIVTCAGKSFTARVAASLLIAAGLPELVTETPEAYRRLAAELAKTPVRLASFRHRLANDGPSSSLFDTAKFTRGLEAAYVHAYALAAHGLPPAAVDLPAS